MVENQNDPLVATKHTFTEFNPANLYLAIISEGQILGARYFNAPGTKPSSHLAHFNPPSAIVAQAANESEAVLATLDEIDDDGCRLAALMTNVNARKYVIVVAESRQDTVGQRRKFSTRPYQKRLRFRAESRLVRDIFANF